MTSLASEAIDTPRELTMDDEDLSWEPL